MHIHFLDLVNTTAKTINGLTIFMVLCNKYEALVEVFIIEVFIDGICCVRTSESRSVFGLLKFRRENNI